MPAILAIPKGHGPGSRTGLLFAVVSPLTDGTLNIEFIQGQLYSMPIRQIHNRDSLG